MVLSPDLVASAPVTGYTELQFFKDAYPGTLAGSIYVSDYALNRVHCRSIAAQDVDSTVSALRQAGLDKTPAIVFDVEIQKLFWFDEGVAGRCSKHTLGMALPVPFDFAAFIDLMKEVHEQDLEYPIEHPRLWTDPANRVPCEAAERVIQLHLVCALKYSAHMANLQGGGWIIFRESEHIAGRTDITVRVNNKCLVAAEIKVLRHRRCPKKNTKKPKKPIRVSDKFNEWWALRGAHQAVRYKAKEKAEEGVLLIYDMRSTDGDIKSVVAQCKTFNVHHKRYFLQNVLP